MTAKHFSDLCYKGTYHRQLSLLMTLFHKRTSWGYRWLIDQLKAKHPPAQSASEETLLEDSGVIPEPVIYEAITADLVQSVMKLIEGSGGPTKVDADFFKLFFSVG